MAAEIKTLAPQAVWSFFYDLTQIPRPTGHTKASEEYVLALAKRLGLEALHDATGNVLVRKPASPGLEGRPTVTLQAHLDMVPQKNSHIEHDFTKDPIDAYIDGEWVTARDTVPTMVSVLLMLWQCWQTLRSSTARSKRSSPSTRRWVWSELMGSSQASPREISSST